MSSQDNLAETMSASHGGANAKALVVGVERDVLLGALLGVAIVVICVLGVLLNAAYRAKAVAEDLRRDDFTYFKQNDWVHLQTDVEVTKQLIAAKCGK